MSNVTRLYLAHNDVGYAPEKALQKYLGRVVGQIPGEVWDGTIDVPDIGTDDVFRAAITKAVTGDIVRFGTGDRILHAFGRSAMDISLMMSGSIVRPPLAVIYPKEDEVDAVIGVCSDLGLRIIVYGAATSTNGGVTPVLDTDYVTVDTSRMAYVDVDNDSVHVGAGSKIYDLENTLMARNMYAVPLGFGYPYSTIGGLIASGLLDHDGGYILSGVEMHRSDGTYTDLNTGPYGPRVKHLAVGMNGNSGIVTGAYIRVRRRPKRVKAYLRMHRDFEDAVECIMHRSVPSLGAMVMDGNATDLHLTGAVGWYKWAESILLRGHATSVCFSDGFVPHGIPQVVLPDLRMRFTTGRTYDFLWRHGIVVDHIEAFVPFERTDSVYGNVRSEFEETMTDLGVSGMIAVEAHDFGTSGYIMSVILVYRPLYVKDALKTVSKFRERISISMIKSGAVMPMGRYTMRYVDKDRIRMVKSLSDPVFRKW